MKRDKESLVIVESPIDVLTGASALAAALHLAVPDDPVEYLKGTAHPTALVLVDSSAVPGTEEDGARLVFEDQRSNG